MRNRERGSTLIESAFVLVVFVLLVCGIVEVSRMAYAFNCVSTSARDAARWASVRGATADDAAIVDYVRRGTVGIDPASVSVSATWTPDRRPGATVDVRVGYRWESAFDGVVPSRVELEGRSRMTVVQ